MKTQETGHSGKNNGKSLPASGAVMTEPKKLRLTQEDEEKWSGLWFK